MTNNTNQIIEAFIKWYEQNEHRLNEDAYPELKTSTYLSELSKEEFIEYFFQFARKGGKVQSGGPRNSGDFKKSIETDYESFKAFVLEPYNEGFDIDKWLKRVVNIKGFGWGTSTIFINRIDKNRFVIVNNKSQDALKALGYNITGNFQSIYHSIEKAQKDLMAKYPQLNNYYTIDALSHFLTGTKQGNQFLPNPISELIEDYKDFKREHSHQEEFYKYKAISHFQKHWNWEAVDFGGMVKESIKEQQNLVYQLATSGINKAASARPNETKELFQHLFDEKSDLNERISSFSKAINQLIKQIDPKLSGNQDERAISVYLTFMYPDTYTYFKNSYYSKACDFLKIEKAKAGQKYEHYLQLIKQLKKDWLNDDDELWSLTNATLPDTTWKDKERNILAQDILFVVFEQLMTMKYWVFQFNPKEWDIRDQWDESTTEDTWPVNAHKNEIGFFDKVILWMTGTDNGCYALCEISSDIYLDKAKNQDTVKLKVLHNLKDNPILKDDLIKLKEFGDFKGGNQGTNFTATKAQYDKIIEMINPPKTMNKIWIYSPGSKAKYWDEFYEKGIMAIGTGELGDLKSYKNKDEIVKKLQIIENTESSKKNDTTAFWDITHSISVGDLILVKKGRSEILGYGIVTSDYYYENDHIYPYKRKVNWIDRNSWHTDINLIVKTLTDLTPYPEYNKKILNLLGINDRGEKIAKENINIPKNLILYGPPGTGKTYRLITEYFQEFTSKTEGKSKEVFTYELVNELSWWEVIVLAMYDLKESKVTDLSMHELMAEKINQSKNKSPRNTIWFWLQNYCKHDCPNVNVAKQNETQVFWKDEHSTWTIDKSRTEEILPDLVDKWNQWKNYQAEENETKRFEMITFHQSYSYEEFVEGIRPNLDEEVEELKYKLEKGIFLRMCEKAAKDPSMPYALFIDEINRGNISKIFGELITLIEPDKRERISVLLPYSKQTFTVPKNLWIIGTMNTADRSIALLDTALRRRFSFIELMPNSSLLSNNIEGIDLQKLLSVTNERIEFLLDRDHTIGHSYLMNCKSKADLCIAFRDKIIPLLQEYFYNDWEKIQLVLGDNKQWGKSEEQKFIQLTKKYSQADEKALFGYDLEDYEDETIYGINKNLLSENYDQIPIESFTKLYSKAE